VAIAGSMRFGPARRLQGVPIHWTGKRALRGTCWLIACRRRLRRGPIEDRLITNISCLLAVLCSSLSALAPLLKRGDEILQDGRTCGSLEQNAK
jgi:hypothetical protein